MFSVDEILNKLEKQTNIPKQELAEKINKKQIELSSLVSFEGAAYLIAKELGINLLDETHRKLEIKNIVDGMKNVNIVGRVFKTSGVIEFKRSDGSSGRVVNIFLGDTTGYVKIPLWNDQVKLIEEENIRVDDIIQVVNGFAKQDVFGNIEIMLGKYGSLRPVEEDIVLPSAEELNKNFFSTRTKRVQINKIVEGSFEVCGTVVHVFRGNFIFNTCPICGNKLEMKGEELQCLEHGKVEPKQNLVINVVVDDGSGDLRAVFFRDLAEKICGIDMKEFINLDEEKRYQLINEKLKGRELILKGNIKKNKIFDRLEMIVNDFKDLNPLEESKKLLEDIKKTGG